MAVEEATDVWNGDLTKIYVYADLKSQKNIKQSLCLFVCSCKSSGCTRGNTCRGGGMTDVGEGTKVIAWGRAVGGEEASTNLQIAGW